MAPLDRVLEPEIMDSAEEATDYDSMDHSAVNRVFVADFLARWNGVGPVLDVGTGTARIPMELCQAHSSAYITAIDAAGHMLSVARKNVAQAGLAARISLELRDAKQLPYADGSFGAVISNSIIHHIPEPSEVIAEMARVTARGGLLFIRDLLRPDSAAELDRLVDLHAAGANEHQRRMFAESLHAALSLSEIQAMVSRFGFSPDSVRQTTDRHWTWVAIRE